MPETWIVITIGAAFFQNLRSALQNHLRGRLSTVGAGYARFLYALPIAALYLLFLQHFGDHAIPQVNSRFLWFCLLGGICQILFTVFLLWMFSFQSFAVGTTFSKLEVIMVAILGAILLGDTLNGWAVLAIAISALGVIALSLGQNRIGPAALVSGLFSGPTLLGLVCAAWLGGSVVFFRGASLSLDSNDFVISAAWTLFISLVIQTVVMGAYLALREQGELTRVLREWRWAGAAGLAGAMASIGWFTAFTIQNASYVRALGQVELVFTFIATTLVFREQVSKPETMGIVLVVAGIVVLLVYG